MRIEELHLKNFRCFKELDIQFPKSNLAVFIGLNGAGKSAILDAISLSLSPRSLSSLYDNGLEHYIDYNDDELENDDIDLLFSDDDINIKNDDFLIVSKIFLNTYKEPLEIYNSKKRNEFSSQSKIIYTGSKVSKDYKKEENITILKYTAIRDKLFAPRRHLISKKIEKFKDFKDWFVNEEAKENRDIRENRDFTRTSHKLDIIRKVIENFCSKISHMNVSNLRVKDLKYNKTDLILNWDGIDITISQLSDGQKNLLLLVLDITFTLINEYTYLKDTSFFKNYDNILKKNGIVLIDEIELHLHPQWQREVLPALQKTFPNIQFIVTTHSPQVLSNLKKEEIFILKDNKISEFKPYIEGRDSNSILSEIFGVSERPKIFQDKLNEFYKAVDNQKLEEAKKLLKNLEEYWGTSDTEILKADLHLSFAEE